MSKKPQEWPHPPQCCMSDETSTHPSKGQYWSPACLETRRQEGQCQIRGKRLFADARGPLPSTTSCAAHAYETIRIPSTACHPLASRRHSGLDSPTGQVHTPFIQLEPGPQVTPHPPQLFGSDNTSWHWVSDDVEQSSNPTHFKARQVAGQIGGPTLYKGMPMRPSYRGHDASMPAGRAAGQRLLRSCCRVQLRSLLVPMKACSRERASVSN